MTKTMDQGANGQTDNSPCAAQKENHTLLPFKGLKTIQLFSWIYITCAQLRIGNVYGTKLYQVMSKTWQTSGDEHK